MLDDCSYHSVKLFSIYQLGRRQQEGWRPTSACSLPVPESGSVGYLSGDTKATKGQASCFHVNVSCWVTGGNTERLALQISVKYRLCHFLTCWMNFNYFLIFPWLMGSHLDSFSCHPMEGVPSLCLLESTFPLI